MDLVVGSPAQYAPLQDQRLYKLTFKCKSLADLQTGPLSNLWIRKDATSSHYILISNSLIAPGSDGNVAFPTTGTAFIPVFAVTNGVKKIDNREPRACPDTQYITGSSTLYLQTYVNYSTNYKPGIVLSLGYAAAGLIPPLWAMFNGNLSGPSKEQLTQYKNTEDPLKDTLAALNTEENYPATVKFGVGQYAVRTAFSEVTINVSYVPSIIKDAGPTAMKYFRSQINTSSASIDTAQIAATCTQLASDLINLGFSKQDDIPFALAYKGIRSKLTADQASTCLGDEYAVAAASIPGGLWEYAARNDQRLTLEQAMIDHPPKNPQDPPVPYQPNFNADRMKLLIDSLTRLTRSDTMAADDQKAFAAKLKEPVTLEDDSVVKFFDGGTKTYSAAELASYLVGKGYRRFGCTQATTLGLTLDGGKSLVLAFHADKDDAVLSVDNVAVVKPLFNAKGTAEKFVVYDDYGWISNVLATASWHCGRIGIKKPPNADPTPAVAAPATAAAAPHS